MSDFLFHSLKNEPAYHFWVFDLIKRQIKLSTGFDIVEFRDLKNKKNKFFDREYFFKLSDIKNVKFSHFAYDKNKITNKSIEYLMDFIDEETLVLGVELGLDLRDILTKNNVIYINSWFHPYKLLDDIFFLWGTNNKEIYKKLEAYKINQEKMYFYANYWKIRINNQIGSQLDFIKNNSLLFVGQTMTDKSIERNGKFLNITDFDDKIKKFSKKYSKIYYTPHPSDVLNEAVNNYIEKNKNIEKIENIPSYNLLACNKIKKVVAVSSSMIYEAQFFNKEIEYLYQSLFDIDVDFGPNSFISISEDYISPKFWSDILDPVISTNKKLSDLKFDVPMNKIRDLKGLYWGYGKLDKLNIICSNTYYNSSSLNNSAILDLHKEIEKLKLKTNPFKRLIKNIKREFTKFINKILK